MVEEKELQEKILVFRLLESRFENMVKQRDVLASKIVELQITLNTIDEMKTGDDVLFSLGSSAYAKGKLSDKNKIIVEVGAGVVLEKGLDEAKQILSSRANEIQRVLMKIQRELTEISSELERLEPEIQQIADEMNKKSEAR
jgi:prefoldin alpha subunit